MVRLRLLLEWVLVSQVEAPASRRTMSMFTRSTRRIAACRSAAEKVPR